MYPQFIQYRATWLNDDNETIQTNMFSLYNMLLNYWFPATEGYEVCPQWTVPESRRIDNSIFKINFVIEYHEHPLLLIEVKPPADFRFDSGRGLAVNQIIQRFDEVGPINMHADRLYAISAIGKRWRAWYVPKGGDSKDGLPVKGIAAESSLRSVLPECWNPDITSDASWKALRDIVNTIKGHVAQ